MLFSGVVITDKYLSDSDGSLQETFVCFKESNLKVALTSRRLYYCYMHPRNVRCFDRVCDVPSFPPVPSVPSICTNWLRGRMLAVVWEVMDGVSSP